MSFVQPFDRAMIESLLKRNSLRYEEAPDGDFVVPFGYIEDADCELTMTLTAAGEDGKTYAMTFFTGKLIPRENWPKTLTVCNTFNQKHRWPTAYLWAPIPDSNDEGEIVLHENINLATGVHSELLDDLTFTVLRGALGFWSWINSEVDLWQTGR